MKSQKLVISLLSLVVFILLAFPQVTQMAFPQRSFDYDTLVEIQARHEKQILSIPGALGIGITANRDGLAFLVNKMGEKRTALAYLDQALQLWQAMGDRQGEARALHSIGQVHAMGGEKQTALECRASSLH